MTGFWEHGIVQKAIAAIIAAGAIGVGTLSISTRDKVIEHEAKLITVMQIQQDLSTIKDTANAIKTDVAVLKDRTERKMTPDQLIDDILAVEGEKYTNDPKDSGGPTKWGWTQKALAQALSRDVPPEEVAALTRDTAKILYLDKYFHAPHFDQVFDASPELGAELTDTGINCGVGTAAIFLQRSLNLLNLNGTKFADLTVDGNCGNATLEALYAYLRWRGPSGVKVLLRMLNSLQGAHYIGLAEKRPKDEAFVYGWFLHRVAIA